MGFEYIPSFVGMTIGIALAAVVGLFFLQKKKRGLLTTIKSSFKGFK